jgi:hypothetical protein
MLKPLLVPKWKCDKMAMDFIVGLLRSPTGLTNKECTFHSHEDQGPDGQVGKTICSEYSATPRGTFSNCVRQGFSLYVTILVEITERNGDRAEVQYRFSSTDR